MSHTFLFQTILEDGTEILKWILCPDPNQAVQIYLDMVEVATQENTKLIKSSLFE